MEIINIDPKNLTWCCRMRQDWFNEIRKEEHKTPKGRVSMKAVNNEMYRKFQALVIGNMLIENMGRKTCLDCLHFRHRGLEFYANYKKEAKELKEKHDRDKK